MKRWAAPILGLVLVVAIAFGAIAFLNNSATGPRLVVTEIRGDVHVQDTHGSPQEVIAGETVLGTTDRLMTGKNGSAVLSLGEDVRIEVDESASVRVESVDEDSVTVELEGGRVRADVKRGSRMVRIGSEGRTVEARDAGFEMSVDDGHLAVDVTRGSLETSGLTGVDRIQAGQRVTSQPDGQAVVGQIPADLLLDVDWPGQSQTAATRVRIEGATEPLSFVTIEGMSGPEQTRADMEGRFAAWVELEEGEQVAKNKRKSPSEEGE